jgi:hypothetical protein
MDMAQEGETELDVRVPFFPRSDQKVRVRCFFTTTIESVKLVIWNQTDIPMKFQRLILRDGQELEDDRTVGDYINRNRVFGGYDMTLMVRGRGGMPKKGVRKVTKEEKVLQMRTRLNIMATHRQAQRPSLEQTVITMQGDNYIDATIQAMSAENLLKVKDIIDNISRVDRIPKEVSKIFVTEIATLEDEMERTSNSIALLQETFELAFVERYFENISFNVKHFYDAIAERLQLLANEQEIERQVAARLAAHQMQD